jgi:hypothetical protein
LIGPVLIMAVALYSGPGLGGLPGGSMSLLYLATAISALTTLIYLLLLRRGQARASVQASAAVV